MAFIQIVENLLELATRSALGQSASVTGDVLVTMGKGWVEGLIWIVLGFALTALFRSVGVSYMVGFIFLNADVITGALWDKYEPISLSANTSMFHSSEGGLLVLLAWGAVMGVAAWCLLRFRDA